MIHYRVQMYSFEYFIMSCETKQKQRLRDLIPVKRRMWLGFSGSCDRRFSCCSMYCCDKMPAVAAAAAMFCGVVPAVSWRVVMGVGLVE